MSRALITGASSYLGNKLADRLSSAGFDVHAITRAQTIPSRIPNSVPLANRHCHDGSTESMIALVAAARPDVTFHLAGKYLPVPRTEEIISLVTSNYLFGVQLLEALGRLGGRCAVVSAGTYSQYYMRDQPRPLNLYSATKQAFGDALALYGDMSAFRTIQLILFDSYGNDDWRKKLPRGLADAARGEIDLPLPDEDIAIDLTHIDDVAAAFLHAAQLLERDPETMSGKIFAVGSGRRYRLSEVVALYERVSGRTIKTRPGAYKLPERRISVPWDGPRLPGWTPKIDLEDGLRQFAQAQRP